MIELSNEVKKAIANTLVTDDAESRFLYNQSINNTSGKGTQNSIHKHQWDYRYNTIIQIADNYDLKYLKLSRGKLWEAVILIGQGNDLYVFFSEKNMQKIISQGKKTHYLILLNLFNEKLDSMKPVQETLTLFDEEHESLEDKRNMAKEMLNILEHDPEKVVVFTFNKGFIPVVKACVYNTKQQLIWEDDLSHLIETDYKLVLEDDRIKPATRESANHQEIKKEKKRIVQLKS